MPLCFRRKKRKGKLFLISCTNCKVLPYLSPFPLSKLMLPNSSETSMRISFPTNKPSDRRISIYLCKYTPTPWPGGERYQKAIWNLFLLPKITHAHTHTHTHIHTDTDTHIHTDLLDISQAKDFQLLEGSSVVSLQHKTVNFIIIKKILKALIIC